MNLTSEQTLPHNPSLSTRLVHEPPACVHRVIASVGTLQAILMKAGVSTKISSFHCEFLPLWT